MENTQDEIIKIDSIKKDIDAAYDASANTYIRCKEDLAFANGIDNSQFSNTDNKVRGENRAQFQFPVLDKFVERIVGGYNQAPYGITYTAMHESGKGKARLLSAVAKGIESRSGAKAVYRTALRGSSTTGYGWVHLNTEYNNPEDNSLDVSIKIEVIHDYSAVLIDPLSREVDGRDARYIAHIDYMNPKEAKEMYGDDIMMYQNEGGMFSSRIQQGDPDDSIPIVTFYEKVTKKRMTYIGPEGEESDEKIDGYRSKEKKITSVRCTKLVGNEIIYDEDIGLTYLPIIPVYGLPVMIDGKQEYVGIIHRAKDAQRLLNYSASLGAERLALSPKANYMVSDRGIEGYEELWKNSSRSNIPALIYKDFDQNTNSPIAPPIKVDTAVNLGDVLSSQANMMQLISSIIGMPENGIGESMGRQETAEAALLKARASETILSTLYENLAASIEQCGRVMMDMMSVYYDTDREVPLVVDGEGQRKEIPFSEMNIIPNEYEVASQAGPLLATQRKENLRSLLAVSQMMGPSAMVIMPEIIDNIDLDDEKGLIKQKIEAIAKMSLQAGGNPEQLQLQMQAKDQEMNELKQANAELQQQLVQEKMSLTKEEIKSRTTLLGKKMDNENDLDVERLKLMGQSSLEDQKASNDVDQMIIQEQMDLKADMRSEQNEIENFLDSILKI